MAVEVENTSQVDEFFRVLKRRFWWILVPAVLISTLGVAYAILVPKKYVASAQLMVYDRPGAQTPGGAPNTAEGRVADYKIKAPQRVIAVLKKLEWPEYEELPTQAADLAYQKKVIKNIEVSAPLMDSGVGQQLVRIKFAHTNADQAEDFLRELLEHWKYEVLETSTRALNDTYEKLQSQLSNLEKKRKELNDAIITLRRDNQIPPKPVGGAGQGNYFLQIPIFEEVQTLQRQITEHEDYIHKQELEISRKRSKYSRMKDTVVVSTETSTGNRELDQARRELEREQGRLAESGWAKGHSKYKQQQAKIEQLQQKVNLLAGIAPSEDLMRYDVPNEKKLELGDEIATLESQVDKTRDQLRDAKEAEREASAKSTALQAVYGEIALMEMDLAKTAELISATSLEQNKVLQMKAHQDGPLGNPFDDLEVVRASDKPTQPNAWLLSIVSVLMGIGAGMGLALILEYSKNCFRSINDLVQSMDVPVLGAINRIETRKQRSLRQARRLVVGIGLLLMVGVVSYTLWAWALRPDLLSANLVEGLDRLRVVLG